MEFTHGPRYQTDSTSYRWFGWIYNEIIVLIMYCSSTAEVTMVLIKAAFSKLY